MRVFLFLFFMNQLFSFHSHSRKRILSVGIGSEKLPAPERKLGIFTNSDKEVAIARLRKELIDMDMEIEQNTSKIKRGSSADSRPSRTNQ